MTQPPGRATRITAVAIGSTILLTLLFARTGVVIVLHGQQLAERGDGQHVVEVTLVPHRGPILDRHGEPLALSVDVPSIYAHPAQLAADADVVAKLAGALGEKPEAVQKTLDTKKPFVWLERKAHPRHAEAVERLDLPGVEVLYEPRRFYPKGALASHVLGFVDVDSHGLGGVEARFEKWIRGEPRTFRVQRDARGRRFALSGIDSGPSEGSSVELTIDAHIQDITQRELRAGVESAKAKAGAAIVLDPNTGEVLALASFPDFDANDVSSRGGPDWTSRIRNRAVLEPYEPGSTFKAILAASALDQGVVTATEQIFCENGAFRVGRAVIHDAHPRGLISFAEVIQYSSNIGATKIAERVGRERYFEYLRAFGFGQRTGIDLPVESPGILRDVKTWRRVDIATHSFGQGVSTTPLQMATAFATIANGGKLMAPHLVRRIIAPDGTPLVTREAEVKRTPIGPEAARITTELLRRVVEEPGGTGGKARLEDFQVAGKTGTAQKVDPVTRAYGSGRIGSFVGFVPADKPRAVILVMIDEPSTSSYGGVVAAPVFRAIAGAVLQTLHVAPPEPHGPPAPAVELVAVPPPPPDTKDGDPGTPSFMGLSLREAMTRAHAAGWDVRPVGSGWVTDQDPKPGSPLADERRLALWLSPERASARP
jgi:cell division protein FtsI (penicillin-binding protein 3)